MEQFDYREVTSMCLKAALKELSEALSLYEQQEYLLSEKKIAGVMYRTTSALRLINLEKEQDYMERSSGYGCSSASEAAG